MNQPFLEPNDFSEAELRILREKTDCEQPPAALRERVLTSYDALMAARRRRENLRRIFLAAAGVGVLFGVSYVLIEVVQPDRSTLPETARTIPSPPSPVLPAPASSSPNVKVETSPPKTAPPRPSPQIRLRGEAKAVTSQWGFTSAVLTVDGELYPLPEVRGADLVLWVTTRTGLVIFDGRKAATPGHPIEAGPDRIAFSAEGHLISLVGTLSLPADGIRGQFLPGDYLPGRTGLAKSPEAAQVAASKGETP